MARKSSTASAKSTRSTRAAGRTAPTRQSRVDYLQNRVAQLEGMVMGIAQSNPVPVAMTTAFETICVQLEPLQDLSPRRTLLGRGEIARLRNLREQLDRPPTGAGGMAIRDLEVPFIGTVEPDRAKADQAALQAQTGRAAK